MIQLKNDNRGAISLMVVLFVMLIGSIILVGMLAMTLDVARSSQLLTRQAQAYSLAELCVEEAIYELYSTSATSGSNDFTFDEGSCTYSIVNAGAEIQSIAEVNGTVSKVRVMVAGAPNVGIVAWEKVTTF